MKNITIEQYCDGWAVEVDDKRFSWNHNDENLGAESIKLLLDYLGYNVAIKECY